MHRPAIEEHLPQVLQRASHPGSPLRAVLEVMQALHEPSEELLADLGRHFSPYQAPEQFVSFLASWVDLGRLLEERLQPGSPMKLAEAIGVGRLRELAASAAQLSRWRGTARGLRLFLEIATGQTGFEIQEHVRIDGGWRPYHITVRAPATARPYRGLVERIIELEKPAYVTHETEFDRGRGIESGEPRRRRSSGKGASPGASNHSTPRGVASGPGSEP